MRRDLFCLTLFLTLACREEQRVASPPAPPKTKSVTTTAPPVKIEGEKKFEIGFAQPDLLGSFVIGRKNGTRTEAATEFKATETIAADVTLKEVPPGLAATLDVIGSGGKSAFNQRIVVPNAARSVSFTWSGAKKPGDYTARLLLGGDQYAETKITIAR